MSIHSNPSDTPHIALAPRLFEVGDFIYLSGSDVTGRVTADNGAAENENPYSIDFSDGEPNSQYSAGYLEMWAPRKRRAAAALNVEKLASSVLKVLGGVEIMHDLAAKKAEEGGDDVFGQIELLADTFADMLSIEVLDKLMFAQPD